MMDEGMGWRAGRGRIGRPGFLRGARGHSPRRAAPARRREPGVLPEIIRRPTPRTGMRANVFAVGAVVPPRHLRGATYTPA
jgi:hypothetical protein